MECLYYCFLYAPLHMQKLRNQKLLLLPCLLIGLAYFATISSLEVNDFWKSQIALIPVQVGLVIYFTYIRLRHRQSSTESKNLNKN